MYNRVILVGRVGSAPKGLTQKGLEKHVFSLETIAPRDGRRAEKIWHSILIPDRHAAECLSQLRSGVAVAVEGTLVYWKWSMPGGERRRAAFVRLERWFVLPDSLMAGLPPLDPGEDESLDGVTATEG